MYLPGYTQVKDRTVLIDFIRTNSFGTLVSPNLEANHYPFLASEESGELVLWAHLSRQNPQWKDLKKALVVFTGPHGYISPTLYENPLNVPTWNYTAVHATCSVSVVEDDELHRRLMREMVATEEARNGTNWSYELPHDFHEKLLKGIVWLRLKVEKLEGKFKLSQNRDLADYEGVMAGLKNERLLKQMVETPALYFRRLSLEDEALVQDLLLSRPDYQATVYGPSFTGNEARESLTTRPPQIELTNKYCFGVFQNRELVAFIDLLRGYPDPQTVYLGLFMVHGKSKGKGLGRRIYEELEALVNDWNEVRHLRLGVATTNKVQGFWEKMGFKRVGEPRPCNVEGVLVVEMTKDLN